MSEAPRTIGFVLPHFRAGGAETVVLNWIRHLDRDRYRPMLFLMRCEGRLLDALPADVAPQMLGATRAMRLRRPIAAALTVNGVSVAYSATNAMNLALLAARCPAGTARIVSEHTSPAAYLAEAKLRWARRGAIRFLYPRADAVAVPTEAIARELVIAIGRPLAVAVLPNPVLERVAALAARKPNMMPHIVAAGRLVPAKGFDLLIDACARLTARGARFRLTICGEGPLRDQLAAQIARAGLEARVTLAGHCDPLDRTIAAADLLVSPSRREGFGNVMVEAMAVGTPVLATRTSGAETLIRDGITGFLCASGDAGALADAIAALLADPARADAVRAQAQVIAARYDAAASTRRFEALVDAAADRTGRVLNPISTRCADKAGAAASRGGHAR